MNEHIAALNKGLGPAPESDCQDNCICFYKGSKVAVVDFSVKRYINKIRKYAEQYPDECQIVAENSDGTITARIPVDWVKVSPKRRMSEENILAARERMKNYQRNKN